MELSNYYTPKISKPKGRKFNNFPSFSPLYKSRKLVCDLSREDEIRQQKAKETIQQLRINKKAINRIGISVSNDRMELLESPGFLFRSLMNSGEPNEKAESKEALKKKTKLKPLTKLKTQTERETSNASENFETPKLVKKFRIKTEVSQELNSSLIQNNYSQTEFYSYLFTK